MIGDFLTLIFSLLLILDFCKSWKAFVSSIVSWMYILKPINTALAKKGILQPHEKNASSDTKVPIMIYARFARITPIGTPA